MSCNGKIYQLYLELLERHGSPEKYWPQWCSRDKSKRDRELIVIGMILVQRTSWHNAELALKNLLKADLLSIKKIADLPSHEPLIPLIRVAGFYQSKPKRLYDLCRHAVNNIFSRENLLKIKGIGPETADTILLYAVDQPTFIIDEYTKQFVKKHNLADNFDYNFLKNLFEQSLPKDSRIYQDFHALIIFDQKDKKGWKMEKM
jgi:endonuclease-3 related protein